MGTNISHTCLGGDYYSLAFLLLQSNNFSQTLKRLVEILARISSQTLDRNFSPLHLHVKYPISKVFIL